MDEHEGGREKLMGLIESRAEALTTADAGPKAIEPTDNIDENDEADEDDEYTPGPRPGRPASPEPDFLDAGDPACRQAARAEYRRAIEEFRRTAMIQEKNWEDFAHLTNPPGLRAAVYDAYCKADIATDDWADEPLIVESSRQEVAAVSQASHEPVALPLVRGVEFDAHAPSRLYSYEEDGPLLPLERPEEPPLPADTKTEDMLNAMIGECHFLMREMAFRSMCHARVLEDRMNWVDASMRLAKTGAKVGKTIGRLRHGPRPKETRHTSTIIQKVVAVASADIGGRGVDAIP